MGFIYKIKNKINSKIYIGLTTNSVLNRFRQHLYESFNSNSRGYNFVLHKAIRKYGEENFEVDIIEEVEYDNCDTNNELVDKLAVGAKGR